MITEYSPANNEDGLARLFPLDQLYEYGAVPPEDLRYWFLYLLKYLQNHYK